MKKITLTACFAAFTTLLVMHSAVAQVDYPARPVRFIIPFAPGGAGDFVGRIASLKLADLLGQPIVVENRPGAQGFSGSGWARQPSLTATPSYWVTTGPS